MSFDILGTSCDQCRSTVQYIFTSTETRRLVRTDSPGRPPRLSHSSWTMYVASTATAQTKQNQKTKTAGVQAGPALPATIIVLWRNYVGDFRLVEFAQQCSLEVSKERKKAHLTLAPNRGCHGVLWTYSGSVVVLSWDLTHKNTQTCRHWGTRMSRHTDRSSLDTNTRSSLR